MVIIKNQEVCHVEINKNANAQKKIFMAHVCLPDDTILVHSCLKRIEQKKSHQRMAAFNFRMTS